MKRFTFLCLLFWLFVNPFCVIVIADDEDGEDSSFSDIVLKLTPYIERAKKSHEETIKKKEECAQTLRERARILGNRQAPKDQKEKEKQTDEDSKFNEKAKECGLETAPTDRKSLEEKATDFDSVAQEAKNEMGRILRFIEAMKKEHQSQTSWKASISPSFSGDSGGGDSIYDIKTSAEISRGTFPRELRFKTTTSFNLSDVSGETTTADVTESVVNYDYHPTKHVQVSGFLERFSSNFLKIDQRYEAGISYKYEWERKVVEDSKGLPYTDALDLSKASTGKMVEQLEEKPPGSTGVSCYDQKNRKFEGDECIDKVVKCWFGIGPAQIEGYGTGETPPKSKDCRLSDVPTSELPPEEVVDAFLDKREEFRTALKKRKARFSWGIAGSLFGEVEQGQALTPPASFDLSTKKDYKPNGDRALRVVFKPSLEFQPIDEISLKTYFYFKQAIFPFKETINGEDRNDYRIDWDNTGELTLLKDKNNEDSLELVVNYKVRFDNAPPFVPSAVIIKDQGLMLANSDRVMDLVAPKTEQIYSLELKISWGGED